MMNMYDDVFVKCVPHRLNPPYEGEETGRIRGITLPADYISFMYLHNGGVFSNPCDHDGSRLVLFSLEEIQRGSCYHDEDGYWLGAAYSQTHDDQNIDTQTVTTYHGIGCDDSTALHQAFYDEHLVIGFCEKESGSATPWIDLIAVDREGNYRVICDGDVEELGRHEFGIYVKTEFGGYMAYRNCLYESPIGLLDTRYNADSKGYRIADRSEIAAWKKKYDAYRTYGLVDMPQWKYGNWYEKDGSLNRTKGYSMHELFQFFLSGEM